MANDIQLKRSSVPGKVPDAGNVLVGEPVVNLNDKILFTKDTGGNIIVIGAGTTSNVAEGNNLYFTNARAIGAFTEGSGINIDANGLITSTATGGGAVDSVNGQVGTVVLTTANVAESGNLYFTNTRAINALTAGNQIIIDSNGLISANVTPGLSNSSISTFFNKTFDVSVSSNNIFSIQGQSLTSYTGSGQIVVLSQSPTISVLNISDSQMNFDGGSGSLYWSGQSSVAQAGDLKAGVYASDPASNNSLFTFATNGSNYMSVGVEGSLFIGTALPSNNGGLNTTFPGWLVVQSGGKFGGTINTLGALQFDDALTGKIIFADSTTQNTAFTTNILTTANVVEVSNLYFTNARVSTAVSTQTLSNATFTGNVQAGGFKDSSGRVLVIQDQGGNIIWGG